MKDNNCPNSKERGLEEQLKSFCYEPFPCGAGFPTSNLGKTLCTRTTIIWCLLTYS